MPQKKSTSARLAGPVVEGGLILLGAGTPLAFGGVHQVTIFTAALVSCFVMILLWRHRAPTHRGLRLPWFGVLLLVAFGWTLLQMVPLPIGLLRKLAPSTVDVLQVSLGGPGGSGEPSWHPISLDSSATLWEALKIGTCALAFIATHNHFTRRHRRDRLLLSIVIGGVLATLAGFIGAVAAPGKPLMIYEPITGRSGGLIATSFVNPNHGSAFLNICTALAVGLAVAAKDLQQRVLFGLGAVLLGAGVFLSLSRGGILALGLAFVVLGVLLAMRRTQGPRWRAALIPSVLGLVLLLSGWLAFEAIINEFRNTIPELNTNLGKVGLWAPGLAMARANAAVGVGRGAFLTTFPRYLSGEMPRSATYSHLENQYLHLPAEWGFPIAALLILGSAAALVMWLRRRRNVEPQTAAITAALLALAFHAIFDFNLEVLGVALPAAILAGALSAGGRKGRSASESGRHRATSSDEDAELGGDLDDSVVPRQESAGHSSHRSHSQHTQHRPGRGKIRTGAVLAPTLAMLLLAAWTLLRPTPLAEDDLARLSAMVAQKAPLAQVEAAVRELAQRHPADPMPHLLAGRLALREKGPAALQAMREGLAYRDSGLEPLRVVWEAKLEEARRLAEEILAWLNRATFLFPGSPDIHLETARALRAFGRRRQALLEYRLALENGAPASNILPRSLSLARNLDELDAGVPNRPAMNADAVLTLIRSKRLDLAQALAARSRHRWPGDLAVASAEVELAIALNEPRRAVELARALAKVISKPATYSLWARAAAATPEPASAIPILQEARQLFPKEDSFAFALAEANLRAKKIQIALKLADEILNQATSPSALAQAHDLLSRIHLADGRPHRAQYEADQARKIREGH